MARYIACLMTLTFLALQSASAQVLTEKSPLDDLSLLPVLDPQVPVKAHKIVVRSCGLEEKRAAHDATESSVTVNSALLKALQEAVGKDSRIDTFIFVGLSPRQGLQDTTLECGILRFTYAAEEASQEARELPEPKKETLEVRVDAPQATVEEALQITAPQVTIEPAPAWTAFAWVPPQALEIVTPVLRVPLPVPRPALKAAPAKKAAPQAKAPLRKAPMQINLQ